MSTSPRLLFVVSALVLGGAGFAAAATREPPPADTVTLQAEGVADWLKAGAPTGKFSTGSELFDAEWHFGTWQMAGLGLAQHAATHPDARTLDLGRMDLCIERLFSTEARAFDKTSWGVDPLDALDDPRGHMAWLGYTNLVLSARRALDPQGPWAQENDALSAALTRRFEAELAPETYPGERYPVDMAAGAASLMLRARTLGQPPPTVLTAWTSALCSRWLVDGVLVQSVARDGSAADKPRGSGSFLAAWFLSWGDPALGAELYRGASARLFTTLGPMGAMREYAPGVDGGGDIDSGPIVAGMGVSATGFAIGAALASGDEATAASLTATATFVGRPVDNDGARHWATGAALGGAPLADAILFAMMATPDRSR